MSGRVISEEQFSTLKFLVCFFATYGIEYQVTGGLAGIIHGSQWPLHDIDVDVPRVAFPTISNFLGDYVTYPYSRYVDSEFDSYVMCLKINEVEIDLIQAEEAHVHCKGQRILVNLDISKAQRVFFMGLKLYVQPIAQLLGYKRLLKKRQADVSDLSKYAEVVLR